MEHELLRASALSASERYRLMTDLIAPRPIAWVSTVDGAGRGNLAPFSYFQAVCSNPATVVLGLGWLADGRPKDTLANILATRQYTINHVSESLAEAMNHTSISVPPQRSEWDEAKVASAPATMVRPPRVAAALASYECRLTHAIPLGSTPAGSPSTTMVIGEVVCFHVASGLLRRDERGRLKPMDPAQLAAVGRLGGIAYTKTTDRFELRRPVALEAPGE